MVNAILLILGAAFGAILAIFAPGIVTLLVVLIAALSLIVPQAKAMHDGAAGLLIAVALVSLFMLAAAAQFAAAL